MAYAGDASGRWQQLDGQRRGFINRVEKYAGFTIQKLCPTVGYDQNSNELQHDFQAVGAQAVNHLANKIMLALFAPSRPFFRLDPDMKLRKELEALGIDQAKLTEMLSQGETAAIQQLDRMSVRPKLYEAIKHLIVTGNALLILQKDGVRVVGIKHYCARRSMSGRVIEVLLKDELLFDELEPDVQDTVGKWAGGAYRNGSEDRKVCLYHWAKRQANGQWVVTQWVDSYQLPDKFTGVYPDGEQPFQVLTWDLSDDAHYGTGLVEDYQGDFAGLSMLSKAQIQGAILSSEFRWLVNPGGATRAEDFTESENGAAIPGQEGDVTLVQSNKQGDMQVVQAVGQEYIQRLGRGFLLGSAVTRDAERVTAEEIRMQAVELETSLGGAYSRLAVDFQIPMSLWLLDLIGFTLGTSGIKPTIVTGLDALSRAGDLDNLKLWLADMAGVATLPEELLMKLKLDAIASALASARRITPSQFIKSDEEVAAEQQARQQQALEGQALATGIDAAGKVAGKQIGS